MKSDWQLVGAFLIELLKEAGSPKHGKARLIATSMKKLVVKVPFEMTDSGTSMMLG